MPAHTFRFQVHIYDTDCYGILWHGHYFRYLEQGRDEAILSVGLSLEGASDGEGSVMYPLAGQRIKYHQPARLRDALEVETCLHRDGLRLHFYQRIWRLAGGTQTREALCLEAISTCVPCNSAMKLLRRLPEGVAEKLALLQVAEEQLPTL